MPLEPTPVAAAPSTEAKRTVIQPTRTIEEGSASRWPIIVFAVIAAAAAYAVNNYV